jgi:hypothetical protein
MDLSLIIGCLIGIAISIYFTRWVFKIESFYKNQERIINILQDILHNQTGKKIPPTVFDDIYDLNDEQKSYFATLLGNLNKEYNSGTISDENYIESRQGLAKVARNHK